MQFISFRTSRWFFFLIISALLCASPKLFTRAPHAATSPSNAANVASAPAAIAKAVIDRNYGKLPLSFEANRGQADPRVQFLARGGNASLALMKDGAALTVSRTEAKSTKQPKPNSARLLEEREQQISATVEMKLLGANPQPRLSGVDQLPGKSSYFAGGDPSKWITNAPTFGRVKYQGVYPDIDLIFYGNQQQLEYDFIVAPGADPQAIKLRFTGADKLRVDKQGDLVLTTKAGEVRQHKPLVYQEVDGHRQPIVGSYVLRGQEVTFALGQYDANRPVVIDPLIAYATFFGPDPTWGLDVDAAGNAYVLCRVPRTANGYNNGSSFSVTKLNATGTAVIYSATFGGSQDDRANDITVDAVGNAYIVGHVKSPSYPTTPGAFQPSFGDFGGNSYNGFVTKLNATGDALVYSTFLKGENTPRGAAGKLTDITAVTLDTQGNAYVTGWTYMSDYPTTPGAYSRQLKIYQYAQFVPGDAFITKLNATGTALIYSTFLGSAAEDIASSIAIDAQGNAYVVGATSNGYVGQRFPQDTPFPQTPGAYQTTDTYGIVEGYTPLYAFVTKINPQGSALIYSTLTGTVFNTAYSLPLHIAVTTDGSAYFTGVTYSTTYPVTPGAFQTVKGDNFTGDVFLTKLNPAGTALSYSTFLGGSKGEQSNGFALDREGNAWVAGLTQSPNFPQVGGTPQVISGNPQEAGCFITRFNAADGDVSFSLFLPWANPNFRSFAIDPSGNVYVAGIAGKQFATTPGVYQTTSEGGSFVAKINAPRSVSSVSAASYVPDLASEAIIAAFGNGLATNTQVAAATPLPTSLVGTTVKLRDSQGIEREAPLFFVSPTQINYLVPSGTASGTVTITVTSSDGTIALASAHINNVAPGLFSADASGQGLAAAVALRVKANNAQSFEPVGEFNANQSRFVALPIDLGPEGEQVFLVLYGTGFRFRSSLSNVTAKVGGVDAPVTYAGPVNGLVGLDQINIQLPRTLIGRGDVDVVLKADGRSANVVKAKIK